MNTDKIETGGEGTLLSATCVAVEYCALQHWCRRNSNKINTGAEGHSLLTCVVVVCCAHQHWSSSANEVESEHSDVFCIGGDSGEDATHVAERTVLWFAVAERTVLWCTVAERTCTTSVKVGGVPQCSGEV